jgi:hypothetical protein
MATVEQEAQQLLAPLREIEPAGPGSVDVERAVRRGRRVHRTRIAASALGVVIAVVAGALVLPSLTHRAQAPAAPAPSAFSVLRQEFRAEAAAGYVPQAYLTNRFQQTVYLGSGRNSATVTFLAAGQVPIRGWTPQGETADPVAGTASPAYYLSRPVLPNSGVELAWQWAPGAWAIVDVAAARRDVGADRAAARQIAEHTHRGPGVVVRTPFSVAAPKEVHLVEVMTSMGPGPVNATLVFGTGDNSPRTVVVRVRAKAVADDGEHAVGHGLVATVDGFVPAAEQQQVLDSVRLSVGTDPADNRYWTTMPIR